MKGNSVKDMLKPLTELETVQVGFLMISDFSLLAFSASVEPLRAANRLREKSLFSWVTAHLTDKIVKASNGLEVSTSGNIQTLFNCRLVLICSGTNVEKHTNKAILAIIRRLERSGIIVGAICSGTYILAKAGMLNDRRCTIHWENIDAMREEFPHLEITNDLFTDNNEDILMTTSTATTALNVGVLSKQNVLKKRSTLGPFPSSN